MPTRPAPRLLTEAELSETTPVVFDLPFAVTGETGTTRASEVVVFVHADVAAGLVRLGQPTPIEAAFVTYESSVPASLIPEIRGDDLPRKPLEERLPADLAALLAGVAKAPPPPIGRAAYFPAPTTDWEAAVESGALQAAVALLDSAGSVIAWIPYSPSHDFVRGARSTDLVAVLSVRGLCQRLTIDGALLGQAVATGAPSIEIAVGSVALARTLYFDLGPLRDAKSPRLPNLDLFLELPHETTEPHADLPIDPIVYVPKDAVPAVRTPPIVASLTVGGGSPLETLTWVAAPVMIVAQTYSPSAYGLDDSAELLALGTRTYDDPWTPRPRPLWDERLVAPGASPPGAAIALWVCSPPQHFGLFGLVAQGELVLGAAGFSVGPSEASRYTALERLGGQFRMTAQSVLPAVVEAMDLEITGMDLLGHGVRLAARSATRASVDFARMTRLRAKSKADLLLLTSRGTPVFTGSATLPKDFWSYMRRIRVAGGPTPAHVHSLRMKELKQPMEVLQETNAIRAILEYGKARTTARRALDFAGAAKRFWREIALPVAAITGATSLLGFAFSAVARGAVSTERAQAEAHLARLLDHLGERGWRTEQHIGASLAALALERRIAAAPDEEVAHMLAAVDVASSAMAFFAPTALASLLLDAALFAYSMGGKLGTPPLSSLALERLNAAACSRFLQEGIAMACLQAGDPGAGILARPDPLARATSPFGAVGTDEPVLVAIETEAALAGISSHREAATPGLHHRLRAKGELARVRRRFERRLGFWLQRIVIHALSSSAFGETNPHDWLARVRGLLWSRPRHLTLRVAGKDLLISRGSPTPGPDGADTLRVSVASLPRSSLDFGWKVVDLLRDAPLRLPVDVSGLSSAWCPGDEVATNLLGRLTAPGVG